MDYKKIIIGIIAVCVIVAGAYAIISSNSNSNNGAAVNNITKNATNHTANVTSNTTGNVTSETAVSSDEHSETSSHEESEPEYGSDSYVERWDRSNQQQDDSWSYLHDQPVKTENGHEYKRMYDVDSGEGYWYQMDQDVNDYPKDTSSNEPL